MELSGWEPVEFQSFLTEVLQVLSRIKVFLHKTRERGVFVGVAVELPAKGEVGRGLEHFCNKYHENGFWIRKD